MSFKEDATHVDNVIDLDFSSNAWKVIKDGAHDEHEPIPETDTQLTSESLKIAKQRFSNNTLASAFHKFGWVFGGTVTRQAGALRHGPRIAVQATAAGRRCKILSRGKAKAQAGRPVKSESLVKQTKSKALSRYHLPIRSVKPPRRKHLLSRNIQLCQHNADYAIRVATFQCVIA